MKSDVFADEANYFWLTPGPVELQTFCVNFKYTLPHPVIWKTPTFLTNFQTFKDWRQFKIRRVYFRNFEGNCTSEKKLKKNSVGYKVGSKKLWVNVSSEVKWKPILFGVRLFKIEIVRSEHIKIMKIIFVTIESRNQTRATRKWMCQRRRSKNQFLQFLLRTPPWSVIISLWRMQY